MRRLHVLTLVAILGTASGCSFTEGIFDTGLRLDEASAEDGSNQQLPEGPVASHKNDGELTQYEQGKYHFDSGRYGLALDAFRAALQAEEPNVKTLNAVAACYDKLRRYDLAIKVYEAALALDPKAHQTLNNIAYSYLLRSEWVRDDRYLAKAEAYLAQAAQVAPGNRVVLGNLQLLAEFRGENIEEPAFQLVAGQAPTQISLLPRDPYSAWLERVEPGVYYLVTQPPEELTARLRETRADPSLAAVQHASRWHR